MKPLNEYETPETDAIIGLPLLGNTDEVLLRAKHARNLERRLAACREALADILDCVDGNYKEVADDCRETLAATKTP